MRYIYSSKYLRISSLLVDCLFQRIIINAVAFQILKQGMIFELKDNVHFYNIRID